MLPPTPAWAPAFAGTGLVGGDVWTRPGLITTHHRDRPLSERESRRWPETAEQAKEVLAPAAMVTPAFAEAGGGGRSRGRYLPQMGDRAREGGKCVPQDNFHLLTRAMPALAKARGGPPFGQPGGRRRHAVRIRRGISRGGEPQNRPSPSQGQACRGVCPIAPSVQPRWKHGLARWKSAARAMSGTAHCLPLRRRGAKTVRLRLVEARETNALEGVEPLHWRLLTTHKVPGAAIAWQTLGSTLPRVLGRPRAAWYQARWTIEQLFRVMKSPAFAGAGAGAADRG